MNNKKIVAFLLVVALLAGSFVFAGANESLHVVLETPAQAVEVSEIVEVDVRITANPGIAGYTLIVLYDRDVFRYVGNQNAGGVLAPITVGRAAGATGVVGVIMGQAGNTSATGLVTTLRFEAISAAVDSPFTLRERDTSATAVVGGGQNRRVPVTYTAGTVTVIGDALPASANITVGTGEGLPGATVRVPVSVAQNPGLTGHELNIAFDGTRLAFGGVSGGAAAVGTPAAEVIGAGQGAAVRVSAEGALSNANGVLFYLDFNILQNVAAGVVSLNISGNLSGAPGAVIALRPTDGQITVNPAQVLPNAVISVGTASISGQNVTVPLNISQNPGIAAYVIDIGFDTARFTLTGGRAGTVGIPFISSGMDGGAAVVVGTNDTDSNANGSLVYITFSINAGAAAGSSPITVVGGELANAAGALLQFSSVNGEVNIANVPGATPTPAPGATPTPTPGATPTPTPGATPTPTPGATPTPTPGATPTPTPGATPTPTPGATPTPTPTAVPTPTPTAAPGATPSPTPTAVPGATPSPTPVATPVPTPGPGATPIPASVRFGDVPADAWFHDSVTIAADRGLFQGTAPNVFDPNVHMTRAMFAAVLANLERVDLTPYAASNAMFYDVAPGAWYYAAVQWAFNSEIVAGMGDGIFQPQTPITREQMAVMLDRYANRANVTLPQTPMPPFADQAIISGWALEHVRVIQAAGIVTGRPDGTFDPLTTATRAEVAAIFSRYLALTE